MVHTALLRLRVPLDWREVEEMHCKGSEVENAAPLPPFEDRFSSLFRALMKR